MPLSRRQFCQAAVATLCARAAPVLAWAPRSALADRFADLKRHVVFEYYAWYGTDPYRHWNEAERRPPIDIASNYMPRLGAYDSRSTVVLEQHAKWIADAGVGAINVSWWGRDSSIDKSMPALMDIMAAHDIHVGFHLEPYADDRARQYAADIEYLLTQYGERRGWRGFLLLADADGRKGPVFKSFRTIVPSQAADCHGVTKDVADFTTDAVWREQTDRVRRTLAGRFDRVTLLADSLDVGRTQAAGFDGVAIYDNFVEPDSWPAHAQNCTAQNLLFSFSVNPGFDGLAPRRPDPSSCDRALPFAPGGAAYDWSQAEDRERAAAASERRIRESLDTTVRLQTDASLTNARRGFFLTYINSFNEWHEGHQFEPMKDRATLTPAERAIGYHNPDDGGWRLRTLKRALDPVLSGGRP